MNARALGIWGLLLGFGMQIPLGLSVAFGYGGPLWSWHRQALAQELSGAPELGPQGMAMAEQLAAMLGATMACWALAMLLVVHVPLRRGELWAWWCVAGSTALWMLVDTGLSAQHGAWTNVAFNLSAGVMIALPLLLCRPGSERDTPAP